MPYPIVLATFNARYAHCALGLRQVAAGLGELRPQCTLVELELTSRPLDAAERILALEPRIVGLGVYIWNVELCLELAHILRAVRPELWLVLGGPEVAYDCDPAFLAVADVVVSGEGEAVFAEFCRAHLGESAEVMPRPVGTPRARRLQAPELPATALAFPDHEYSDADLRHRVVYVEAARGCPMRCAFCLSAREHELRLLPRAPLFDAIGRLWRRGARVFKFVDRSINLQGDLAPALLDHFAELAGLARACTSAAAAPPTDEALPLSVHFECFPRLPSDELLRALAPFPAGAVQLEIGVQTLAPEVAERIGRPRDGERVLATIRRFRQACAAHLHSDLIVGLPGEDEESFARGFDALHAAGPHEIQVGILKRLRGTPLAERADAWGLRFSPRAPYEILASDALSFAQLQRLRRFARVWELVANSGRFEQGKALLVGDGSAYGAFAALSDWLFTKLGGVAAIALSRWLTLLFDYLRGPRGLDLGLVAHTLLADYLAGGHNDVPPELRPYLPPGLDLRALRAQHTGAAYARRQQRHHGPS